MANMNVQMTLTLADTASGPLRAFVGVMDQLNLAAGRAAPRLDAIAAGITRIGNAAAGASGVQALTLNLAGLDAAMAGVRAQSTSTGAGITNLAGRASAAGGRIHGLELAVGQLGTRLTAAVAQLTAATAGMTGLAAAGQAAGQGVNAGAAQMGAGLQAANTHATGLHRTMLGLAGLWASSKIKDGFVASAQGATRFETATTRMQNMSMSQEERSAISSAVSNTLRTVPQFDRLQTTEMAVDLRGAMNSVEGAIKVLTPMAQMAYNMKLATPSDKELNPRAMLDVGKFLQQRGAVTDPARMQAEMDMLLKIYTATQGRVDMQQMLGNLQQAKGGLGDNVDLAFMPIMAAMIEQTRAGGGSGGTIGTQLTQMQRYILGNVKQGTSAKEAARLGLIDNDKVVWNSQGNINLQKSELRMAGADQFQRNPYEWVQSVLKPALVRAGVDMADNMAVNRVLTRLFPTANPAEGMSVMVTKGNILEADASITNRTLGNVAQTANNVATSQAKWDALTGKMRDLAIVVGEKLLPVLRVVADVMGTMLDGVGAFFTAFPVTATFMTWAVAIGAVVVAVRSLAMVFGIAGTLGSLITGIGAAFGIGAAAATAGAAATTAAATTAATAAGVAAAASTSVFGAIVAGLKLFLTDIAAGALAVGKFFMRMIPYVGLLIVAWDLVPLLLSLIPGGERLKAWFGEVFDWMVGKAREAWRAIGGFITGMFPSANASTGPRDTSGSFDGPARRGEGGATGSFAPDQDYGNEGRNYRTRRSAALFTPSVAPERPERAGAGAGGGARAARPTGFDGPFVGPIYNPTRMVELAEKETIALNEIELRVKRDLLTTANQRRAAEALRIQVELDGDLKRLVAAGRITQAEADIARNRAQAAVDIKQREAERAVEQETYKRQLLEIDAAERNGEISETATAKKRQAIHKQEAAALNDLLAKELALAEARGDVEGAAKLRTAMAQNTVTLGQLPPEAVQGIKAARDSFGALFAGITNGTIRTGNDLKKWGANLLKTFSDIISKRMGDQLFDSLFGGGKSSGGKSGGGGLLAAAGNWLGGLFGGGSSGNTSSFVDANAFGNFAVGTDYVPHDMLAMVHKGERITPAAFNPAIGNGPQTVSQSFHFSVPVDRRTAMQVGADAQRGLVAARRNL